MPKKSLKIYSASELGLFPEKIDSDAHKIILRLQRHGFDAFVVGGGVRDLLLNKQPKDFDIATNATPNQIRKLFRNSRVIGRRFKLVHIYFARRKIIEVSTFRSITTQFADDDSEDTDNHYGNIETDALRRDLTINALFYNPESDEVFDYVHGIKDIQKRRVQIIGKPDERFKEDPVRMIRTIRHQARTGFSLDKSCIRSIKKLSPLILECPPMRIFEEIKKDLSSGYFQEILLLLMEYGFTNLLLPKLQERLKENKINKQDFMFCLKGIDRIALEDRLKNATIPLTILTLFMNKNFNINNRVTDCFHKQIDINVFVSSVFPKLAVPKKEKQKISSLIKTLWQLENAYARKKKVNLQNIRDKYDLKLLVQVLNINNSRNYLRKYIKF